MAGRNYPIPGGTRSRRSRPPAFTSWPPTCAATARARRRLRSPPTRSSTSSATWSAWSQALGETKAIVVGHDWGAPVAWHAALFRPDIFTAVAGLSVPPPFRGRGKPLELLRQGGITNFYWQYFQAPGVAEAEFEHDVARTMRIVLGGRGTCRSERRDVRAGGQGLSRPCHRRGAAAGVAERGRSRLFHRSFPQVRLPRRAELVSQPRPQLGADRALAGRADPPALALHRRRAGCRHHRPDRRQARQRAGARAAQSDAKADHRGRRPLGAAGAARRGQRRADQVPARSGCAR